jgi:hypothetical protein
MNLENSVSVKRDQQFSEFAFDLCLWEKIDHETFELSQTRVSYYGKDDESKQRLQLFITRYKNGVTRHLTKDGYLIIHPKCNIEAEPKLKKILDYAFPLENPL